MRWLDLAVYLAFLAFAAWSGPRGGAWYAGLCLAGASVPLWSLARWQFGALLALLGWSATVIGLIVAPVEVVRARREERVLAEAFGEEYLAYQSTSWF